MLDQYPAGLDYFVGGQGVLLSVLILAAFQQPNRRHGCYLLSVYLMIQSVEMILNSLAWEVMSRYLIIILFSGYFLLGPLLFLYTYSITAERFRFRARHIAHLIPAILVGTVYLPSINLYAPVNTSSYAQSLGGFMFSMVFIIVVYTAGALLRLTRYQRAIGDLYSSLDDISLAWLFRILILFLITSLFLCGVYIFVYYSVISQEHSVWILRLCNIAQFYLIAIAGCRSHLLAFGGRPPGKQADIPDKPSPLTDEEGSNSDATPEKYKRAQLSIQRSSKIWDSVCHYMVLHKPYVDSELQLKHIADAVEVSLHDLSQTINRHSQENFYSFVNGYRAQKACHLIEQYADSGQSIIDIAFESGFSSTATFYKHFKKHFSMTPSQYRKNYRLHLEK
jgi:AraC-like DNA-binding protein